jgi:hypothetical protein
MYRRGLALSVVALLGVLGGTGLSASAFASAPDIPLHSIVLEESPVGDSSTPMPEEPVAEQSSAPDAPVIMVTGLAVLIAAILMVVRSGSSRRLEEE